MIWLLVQSKRPSLYKWNDLTTLINHVLIAKQTKSVQLPVFANKYLFILYIVDFPGMVYGSNLFQW
jgi:hypothetical protein